MMVVAAPHQRKATHRGMEFTMLIGGAICEETDCTGLVLIILAALAALVIVAVAVALAWAAAIAAILERRGRGPAERWTTAGVSVFAVAVLLWALGTALPSGGAVAVWLLVVPALPIAFWQRSVTKRFRKDQSSPCSTA